MRIRTFALLASLAMSLSAAGSWALSSPAPLAQKPADDPGPQLVPAAADRSRFVDGKTLLLEGRLGRASIPRTQASASSEAFVLATITGAEAPAGEPRQRPPVHLAIVVDRSGSMAGSKMRNAILAGVGAVERMNEGDRVTVVAFDTTARVLSPSTVLSAATRPGVEAAIRSIQPGGDTCISCALETASTELEDGTSPASPERGRNLTALGASDEVRRVLLISDGEATTGVRDVGGLRNLASRVSARGFSVSTIGVDLAFDEKVMAAIAQESNGKHWFVPDASALAGVFQEELGALQTAVATGAELSIEPASGVVIQDVLDRPFRREGGRVVVQLGTFDPRQEKTVLLRAQVPSDGDGAEPVAKLALAYRDVTQRLDARCGGSLELQVRSDGSAQPEIDPFVAARLERSRTARTLTDANDLFEHGKGDEARARLAERRSELSKVEGPAKLGARAAATSAGGLGGMIGRRSLDADFSEQESVIEQAQSGFAPPPPSLPVGHGGSLAAGAPAASPAAKSAVRSNQANAVDLAF